MNNHKYMAVLAAFALLFTLGCGDEGAPSKDPAGNSTAANNGKVDDGTPVEDEGPVVEWNPALAGSIKGTVTYNGTVDQTKLSMSSDAFCSKAHSGDMFAEDLVVKDKKVRYVLVYIKKIKVKGAKVGGPVTIDQNGCMYQPHVVAIQRTQTLVIKNSDNTSHNIHFLPDRNKEENFSQAKAGMTAEREFKIPEVGMKVKCDVHPWMAAYIHVMKHPFYAVTDENGNFEIKDVPPGEYELITWHETLKEGSTSVKVSTGSAATADFELKK